MRYLALSAAFAVCTSCQTAPVPPEKLPAATLRSYVIGHWFQEMPGDFASHQFEIDYKADGTVTALQWDRAHYPNGTPKVWHYGYAGTWDIRGTKLVHNWKARGIAGTVPEPTGECTILRLTANEMALQDTFMSYFITFYRKPHLTDAQ
jgi:hypothetical protein